MEGIFTIKNIIIYLICINIMAFTLMYIDKRRAQKDQWRIKESTLFMFVFLGGGVGGIVGMYMFRHKTKKVKFIIGFPAILIIEAIAVIAILTA